MTVRPSDILEASKKLENVVRKTPTELNANLSARYKANIYLKREDLQVVRSYKIRGAYNAIASCTPEELQKGIVCASAGNHAQGVALTCQLLDIKGHIFMPTTTPQQKIKQVKMFGKKNVEVILTGDTFDDAYKKSVEYCNANGNMFIPPFDNPKVISGQGTVGLEIIEAIKKPIDYLFIPVGGGGLVSGVSIYFDALSPTTKIIGVEPLGAPAMKISLEKNEIVTLESIDKFVDGAAVKRVGNLNFEICKEHIDDIVLVPEGKVCTTILQLYGEEAIVVEPAGALSIAALDFYKDQIVGKNVVCIVSGSNNDIDRMQEIKERSLVYENLKHYFIITFPQRAGALREFLTKVLGENDDITFFEYTKKTNKEYGSAAVGIELQDQNDYEALVERMKAYNFPFTTINDNPSLFSYLI
ncbi:MAG: threonine dehydratase [Bacteroidetes bacterium]|nr:MAG: threonine dehydratase [Bacteroidota bacterium]